jgi:hypothetical protein
VQGTKVTLEGVAVLEKAKPGIVILSGAGPFPANAPAQSESR